MVLRLFAYTILFILLNGAFTSSITIVGNDCTGASVGSGQWITNSDGTKALRVVIVGPTIKRKTYPIQKIDNYRILPYTTDFNDPPNPYYVFWRDVRDINKDGYNVYTLEVNYDPNSIPQGGTLVTIDTKMYYKCHRSSSGRTYVISN
ncbi:unnamed protein product [Rhizophagus irregularis]|nr:unnamed protein product [Rhizophagus irregularis]CAB4439489.1 unnamed protein product [Rhizophagus irregularis]